MVGTLDCITCSDWRNKRGKDFGQLYKHINCDFILCNLSNEKVTMKSSPTLVLQFFYCINMQIYKKKTFCQNVPLSNQLFHFCTSQMYSQHESLKLNQ